jgi:hypothetical protein
MSAKSVPANHRYLIETEGCDYPCDDYKFNPTLGITCIKTEGDKVDLFTIYSPICAIHDFEPTTIKSLRAFRKVKNQEMKNAHLYIAAAQQQFETQTKPTGQECQ